MRFLRPILLSISFLTPFAVNPSDVQISVILILRRLSEIESGNHRLRFSLAFLLT
jgi:hypothetical protein